MTKIDLSATPTPESASAAIEWLSQQGYRVTRPMIPRDRYSNEAPQGRLVTIAILDTETTGTNPATDKLIELGVVLVEVCPDSGQAYRVLQVFDALEDPGAPIPPESTRIHHITDEMVAGKRIDDAAVTEMMRDVALVIAHNASFDRAVVEKRFPLFADKFWACTFLQMPWAEEDISSAKLEFLAYRFGFHFTGHRASVDCLALLEVLQQDLPVSERKAMRVLLENARKTELRVTALQSPFETKDVLKGRGYRWNPDKRAWATVVAREAFDDEIDWLREAVYSGNGFQIEQEVMTGKNRFSTAPRKPEVIRFD